MKQTIILCLFCIASFSAFSQEKVLELGGIFSQNKSKHKESYVISNKANNDLVVIAKEGSLINATLFDSNYKAKYKLSGKPLSSKYSIIGYNIDENTYTLFYKHIESNGKFSIIQFDFNNSIMTSKKLDFKLKFERYITSFIYHDKIHIFTVKRNSSIANIYKFDKEGKEEKNNVDFGEVKFIDEHGTQVKLYDVVAKSYFNTYEIKPNIPNPLKINSKKNKIYSYKNGLILSLDNEKTYTQLCYIDLNNYTLKHEVYDNPIIEIKKIKESNSSLYDEKLFQIASSNHQMAFTIRDLDSKKIIKEYKINKEDSIAFKNSAIVLENDGLLSPFTQERIRETEKTAKFLRKVCSSNIGISVYKTNKNYKVTLGGTISFSGGGSAPMLIPNAGVAMSIPIASGGNISISAGVSTNSYWYYDSYKTRKFNKSTYIDCLFDKNFNHVKGDITNNVFDNLNEFEETLEKPTAINLFFHNNNLHYAYFDGNDRTFKLYRFEN